MCQCSKRSPTCFIRLLTFSNSSSAQKILMHAMSTSNLSFVAHHTLDSFSQPFLSSMSTMLTGNPPRFTRSVGSSSGPSKMAGSPSAWLPENDYAFFNMTKANTIFCKQFFFLVDLLHQMRRRRLQQWPPQEIKNRPRHRIQSAFMLENVFSKK